MRLVLLCQAATTATRENRFSHPDDALEERALGRLKGRPPRLPGHTRCMTSPARAALATAAALGLAARQDPALRDVDFGAWSGRALEEVAAGEPAGLAAWLGDGAFMPPGGESLDALAARIKPWMDQQGTSDGTTLAITHAAVVRAAVATALGAGLAPFWRIDVPPLSVTTLSGATGRWTLAGLRPL